MKPWLNNLTEKNSKYINKIPDNSDNTLTNSQFKVSLIHSNSDE